MLVLGNGVDLVGREIAKADQVFETDHRSLRPLKSLAGTSGLGCPRLSAPSFPAVVLTCRTPRSALLFQRCRKFRLSSWKWPRLRLAVRRGTHLQAAARSRSRSRSR